VAAVPSQEANDPHQCSHGLRLSSPHKPSDECRVCLPGGETVDAWIDAHPDPTHGEIGAVFGLTRERIRQIEAKALAKLDPKFVRVLGILASERGEVVSEAERFARIVRRMLAEGFDTDEIVEALNVPSWRVGNVIRPNTGGR
jgi:hypothetical protein